MIDNKILRTKFERYFERNLTFTKKKEMSKLKLDEQTSHFRTNFMDSE